MNIDLYKQQNDELLYSVLKRQFFDSWQTHKDGNGLELFITPTCNLQCKYCYINRHGKELYHEEYNNSELILKNLNTLLDWLIENHYKPRIDFFAGAPLSQKVCIDSLNLIYEKFKDVPKQYRIPAIVVPSNFTFIIDYNATFVVEELIKKFKNINIDLYLSASIEGKYMEQNRPFKKEKTKDLIVPDEDPRNDEYYDKVFQFVKKYNYGFHPMIYSQGIEKWKDNFLWYQEMLAKYGIPWNNIYLLEVRNQEWNDTQITELCKFLEFLVDYSWHKCDEDSNKFVNFIVNNQGFNILPGTIFNNSRGLPCSIQTLLYVRLGDLGIVPCHRTSYDGFEYGKFKTYNDKIIGIDSRNVELAQAVISADYRSFPMCENCMIAKICNGGCLGAQLEYSGDMFVPIPTVCQLYYQKTFTVLKALNNIGQLENLRYRVDEDVFRLWKEILNVGGIK